MLYLKDEIADFVLLQFPFNTQFDYPTLLQVCHELQGHDEISFQTWQGIAQSHFLFSVDQTELYFETFSLLIYKKVDQLLKPIPTIAFILFLYNQLFNQTGMAGSRIDSEFPNLKEEPHDPLGSLIYPHFSSRISIASLEDLDLEDLQSLKSFPSSILERRHKLASYWRSSAKKWLSLIYVCIYGPAADVNIHSHQAMDNILLQKLNVLEVFFTAVSPPQESDTFRLIQNKFSHWLSKKEDYNQATTELKMPRSVDMLDVSVVDLAFLIENVFKPTYLLVDRGGPSLSIDNLMNWFHWSIMERPPSFNVLELAPTGYPQTLELPIQNILSNISSPQVVLSRRKNLIIPVPSHFIENKTVLIHRLHNCEVYLVGAISNLIVSKCKNCHIFAGAVAEQVIVKSCSKTSVSACCSRIIFSDEENPSFQPGGNTAYVSTLGRPVVEFYTEIDQFPVHFAPCNLWYRGMLSDLNHIGHILSPKTNRFHQQITPCYLQRQTSVDTLIDSGNGDNVNLIPVEQFSINEIPFDVVETGDDRIEEDLPQIRSEEEMILRAALPSPYKEWIEQSDALKLKVRNLFKQASAMNENFMKTVTSKFEEWLDESNHIQNVNAMYKSAR